MQVLDLVCYEGKGYRITGFPSIKDRDGQWCDGVAYEPIHPVPGAPNSYVRFADDFDAKFRPIAFTISAEGGR